MIAECHYRIDWRSSRAHPGSHRSRQSGPGHEFQGYVPLHRASHPRHLDLRASLRDPTGQFHVRQYRDTRAINVYLLADVSASMQHARKLDSVAACARSLAYSALRNGDRFSLLAADTTHRTELDPLATCPEAGLDTWCQAARKTRPTGQGACGLSRLAAHLEQSRALVFVLSDFHWPMSELTALQQGLAGHDVVPVVVWESSEYEGWPDYRLVCWQDPETGLRRRYWMRPGLRARLAAAYAERREALTRCFSKMGRPPLFMLDGFDADALTRYFYQGVTA